MRARSIRRVPGAARMVAGALVLALPVSGIVIHSAVADAQPDPVGVSASAHHGHHAHHVHHRPIRTRIIVHRRSHYQLQGRTAAVRGRLLHARRHARVDLQGRTGHRWFTIARGRVGRHGHFKLRFRVHANRPMWLRVRFRGAHGILPTRARAGKMVGLAPSVASWYYDGGGTACGFHAGYGVANKTLPCGTHVTFKYHGHTVTATVDDRGPYVAGRSYDLNQNTAAALGMHGVATVDTSVS